MKSTFFSTLPAVLSLVSCGFANAQDTTGRGMEFYLEHCKSCHGSDAAGFAARSLQLGSDGMVQTRTMKPLAAFLSTHGAADERDRRELLMLFEKLMRTDGR